ncbi:MAG: hypothetical protein IJ493_00250 [Clostridia bacterium]|nr:hypothetical protein [Clostridia bacterium]
MPIFHYIADGRLYACTDKQAAEIRSSVLDTYLRRVKESAGRNEWKHSGEGAAFRGAYVPGADAESRVAAVHSRVFCAVEQDGALIYSLAIDRSTGIYSKRPDSDTDGIVISSGDTAYADFDIRGGRIALTSAFAGESHIGVLDMGKTNCQIYTEGHTWDSQPVWSEAHSDQIYFCCAGLPLNSGGEDEPPTMDYSQIMTRMFASPQRSVKRGPSSICLLDISRGSMDELLCDERYDYVRPQSMPDGSLYYIRRPYRTDEGGNKLGCLADALLFPLRMLRALFGFFNVFSAKYSGKTLSKSAGVKQRDEEKLFIDGNLINAEAELRANQSRGDEHPGIIPHTWELHRLAPDGSDTLVRRGVAAYFAEADGSLLISNGSAILRRTPDGREEKLLDAARVTFIRG